MIKKIFLAMLGLFLVSVVEAEITPQCQLAGEIIEATMKAKQAGITEEAMINVFENDLSNESQQSVMWEATKKLIHDVYEMDLDGVSPFQAKLVVLSNCE